MDERLDHPYGSRGTNGEGLICHETPDEDGLNACRELGRQLADA